MIKSPLLAYWIGLAQSDGFISNRNGNRYLRFENTNIELVKGFRNCCKVFFNKPGKIWTRRNQNSSEFRIKINDYIELFRKFDIDFSDPPKPPIWCSKNSELFGAYLAGIIDGDGDVRIKRPKYPQCGIRIHSGTKQTSLAKSIEKNLKCKVSITKRYREVKYKDRIIKGHWYEVEFYVSLKNINFVQKFILPYIKLNYKADKIRNYILKRIEKF